MLQLPPRLAAVARHVPQGQTFADIGTDHAYLPAHLVAAGHVPRAVAGDILPGPLAAARNTVDAAGLADRIDLRLGPGLSVLAPGEAACVAVCGMGGPLIARILEEGPLAGVRRLVLQPMGGEAQLRRWLAANGWKLVAEEIVEDGGRLYPVLVAEPGEMALSRAEEEVGPLLLRQGGPLVRRHVAEKLALARRALEGAQRSDRPAARARAAELAGLVRLLAEAAERLGEAPGGGPPGASAETIGHV
ncbi:tRNA (adenine22-N1)-methyltransferase [Symbiobacterium terraclitae]|uniref:tRNA (Adenine22-N1)-methyltransferase n=1 Tax=Symbiobacterium terraclitae TaxID=557451 RepID=A0ABS4JPU5_9FIRM|nr:class I SAM-dependent methyltransferase [Symbiobacterium terraclitae]MBP2017558.1 tRNA (adenine22-N1)-methyltransferase [Symbiobacterium terraclitae]